MGLRFKILTCAIAQQWLPSWATPATRGFRSTPQLVRVTESVLLVWPVLIKYIGKIHYFLRNQLIKHVMTFNGIWGGAFRSASMSEKCRLISLAPSLWFVLRCKCQITVFVFCMCTFFCFVSWLYRKLISKCQKWISNYQDSCTWRGCAWGTHYKEVGLLWHGP